MYVAKDTRSGKNVLSFTDFEYKFDSVNKQWKILKEHSWKLERF